MKTPQQILMDKAKAYREERDKVDREILTETIEACRDVLEHYDNDTMIKGMIEEIDKVLRITKGPSGPFKL